MSQTTQKLEEYLSRRLESFELAALMMDGLEVAGQTVVVTLVRYARHGPGLASSASYATRIAEVKDAGTARETEKPVGDDRGFLWRLNSYWRFEEAWGGVIVELESISLSRGVPVALRWLVGRYLDSVPRESIAATLEPIRRETPRSLLTDRAKSKRAEAVGNER